MNENDLKWVTSEKRYYYYLTIRSLQKPDDFKEIGNSSERQNDALMHREGLKG